MGTINKSKHIIEFEHLYKKGQTVWFLFNEKAKSGKVEIVEFNPDNGSVCYFVKEMGWFEEEDLFYSEKELEERTIERLQHNLAQERQRLTSYKLGVDNITKIIKKLESSPWLAKATNQDE